MNASARSACSVLLLSFAPLATTLAQAIPGYDVEKSQSVQAAPAGSVGRKTTDREHRVGTAEDTLGNDVTYVLVFGGFAQRCPTSAGIVEGDFEYSISYDAVVADDDGLRREHHTRTLVAQLAGEVGDEAHLKHVDLTGDFTVDRSGDGVPRISERRPVQVRFTPGAQGEPDIQAMMTAADMTADVAVASAILTAGTIYREAEVQWRKPNECVELSFDPPTDTAHLGPNEQKQVRADLKSKGNAASVPWMTDKIDPIGGVGTVTPRRVSAADSPSVTLTYTASARPRRGNGIDVVAYSRGGIAYSPWRIVDTFEGTFTQTRTMDIGADDLPADSPFAGGVRRYGIQASQNYEITGRLVWRSDESRTRAPLFNDVTAITYVPADGEITVNVLGSGRSMAGACVHEGSKTFMIRELPPAALQYLQLDRAPDGRYKLMLGMVSFFLQFQLEGTCNAIGARRIRQTVAINDASIALGVQEGVVTNDTVSGQTSAPIVYGPDRYTGRWEFKSSASLP